MFRKVSRWLTDKGDQFVRGGGPQEQMESAYDNNAELEGRPVMDPFNDGDQKYGGRQPYRSRAELEAEAAQQAQLQAQQEAEAYQSQLQAQYMAQQEQMQQTGSYQAQQGYQQPQQAVYQQEQMQQTGSYQAQQGYQQAAYQQEQMQQTGSYQAQQGYQQAAYQQEQMQQTGSYQAQQGYQQAGYQQMQGSNVVTFPGMQSTPDGMVYAHVEYIVQLCNRHECRKVIDYIRTNASVFLNMEMIADGSERQRCVDMLSGAAYALGCALNKISPRGVYLISSPSVRVMMDNATQKMASTPEVRGFARQSYGQEIAAQQQPRYDAQPQPAEEEYEEPMQNGGFSSGSPTQRFQSQGAQGMSVSFGTAMAGSHTSMHRAINAQRYSAQ